MSIVNQLIGTFSPIAGSTNLANGYLILRLNVDSIVNSTTLVCSGYDIRINLDSNGSIITSPSQSVWPNDAMTPTTAGYYVSAYTASGQLTWGPNLVKVLSSPSPFNTGAWIPS